ncbi:SAV_2336 N-terminal domain-related protein [Actinomadura sp. B10D3]|uniref:SAV_2336 N-terminal domain-related protein n=1 Tax=Actinomadura sp. B10D3 TaxID=3153557 RepID=UPI00325E5CA4
MTIDRLRDALSAIGPPPDARELSEMLWLACHISPPGEAAPPGPPVLPPVPEERADEPGLATPSAPPAPPPPAEPPTGLHPRPTAGAEPAGEASEVLVPTAPMLTDPLGVQRALRPLKRRVPSRHRRELDEDATAARIADTGLWTPVLVPSPERWLGLSLVVDAGPTMRLWRPLARELAETLVRQGAFQDVHVGYLDATGRITSSPEAPPRDPRTLLDASGRQAVLVLSDCSGPHWWDGRAVRAVRHWAQAGPTAIVQPLAERLWRRTAAPAAPGLAHLPRPGAPNTDLRFTPYDGAAGDGVPVPVLEIAPRWFGTWARLVAGSEPQPAAVAALPARPSRTAAPVRRERELPVAERVRRFLATASPDAAELAAHVAVSVPSLPVMRLIQHRILGGSGPGQLAEVLLSGLLRPAGGVHYEFVPGAREALLDTLPRPEALHTRHVLEAVSAEIERRAGTAAETFRALIPADGGPVTLAAETDHFAVLTSEARGHLVPGPPAAPDLLELFGRPVDELLGDDWDRPSHPTPIGVDSLGPVSVDVLRSHPELPHGQITGPRPERDDLMRTLVMSLALSRSPNVVNFNFYNFSGPMPFAGLGSIPHTTHAMQAMEVSHTAVTEMTQDLEAERQRRKAVLRTAGVRTWDRYQIAVANGRPLDPLPALIVFIFGVEALLEADRDLGFPLRDLCEKARAQGIIFVFCEPSDSPLNLFVDTIGWILGTHDDDAAFLHVLGEQARPGFRPARISVDEVFPLGEQMRRHFSERHETTPPSTVPEPDVTPTVVPRLDVLRLNGGGSSGVFREAWAQPASTPRNPAIGFDPTGNVVSLYPLDASAGLPHGLIVGSPEARQRIVRAITLTLAAGYSPENLHIAFAGLGRHPLGDPRDLPHVRYTQDELLGHPGELQRFLDYLTHQLNIRSARPPRNVPGASEPTTTAFFEEQPRLLVVADISLTFPQSRREVGETLLAVAQRGRALGVQLLLTSSTVENTMIWDRFLPLLGWRIVASPLPPAELGRVLGRSNLPFSEDRSAYLLAGGGTPQPFTVAEEPPAPVVDGFIARVWDHWRSISTEVTSPEDLVSVPGVRRWPEAVDPAVLDHLIADLDEMIEDESQTREGDPVDGAQVRTALRQILRAEADDLRLGVPGGPHHLLFPAPHTPEMNATARQYGNILADLGALPRNNMVTFETGDEPGSESDPADAVTGFFLVRDRPAQGPEMTYLGAETIEPLISSWDENPDGPLMILCGDPDRLRELLRTVPGFADRFRWVSAFEAPPARPQARASLQVRLGSDPETGEPVLQDFGIDRHLLISGPYGPGRTMAHRIVDQLVATGDARDQAVYVLDEGDARTAPRSSWAQAGVRYTTSAVQFAPLLDEAIWRARAQLMGGTGPSVYVVVAGRQRLLLDDPLSELLPQLRSSRDHGLHLVLVRHQMTLGEPTDPVVMAMRELGAPVLLTSYVGGHEAKLWWVPPELHRHLTHGLALLAHPDRRRFVSLDELT